MNNILVTGGAGYIGSHTLVELIKNGYDPIVVDNLSNSKMEAVRRVEKITGKKLTFIKADLLDKAALVKIFTDYKFESVINFAGFNAVGESVAKPLEYYNNNLTGMLNLLFVMRDFGVKNIVFSSSATVYGDPEEVPIKESAKTGGTTNPYGSSKLFIEYFLKDLYKADNSFNIAILRYFNPVGAHESGLIGEDPRGIPNNLCPYISKVAIGELPKLRIFGDDYDTPDGTGVRDYIHVVDLARAHVLAIKKLETKPGLIIANIGTGVGYSVLDMVKAFSKAVGRDIPYEIVDRRPGDIAACYADPSYAYELLGFKAEKTLDDMCRDSWNWQQKNPHGYEE